MLDLWIFASQLYSGVLHICERCLRYIYSLVLATTFTNDYKLKSFENYVLILLVADEQRPWCASGCSICRWKRNAKSGCPEKEEHYALPTSAQVLHVQ